MAEAAKEKVKAGWILALILAVLGGLGLGLMFLGMGFSEFIMSIGGAKMRYPEVVYGFIALIFALFGVGIHVFKLIKPPASGGS